MVKRNIYNQKAIQPKGYENKGSEETVNKLQKALCRLKQAPRPGLVE